MASVPMPKLRSLNTVRSRMGSEAMSSRMTKPASMQAASTPHIRTSVESNQARGAPLLERKDLPHHGLGHGNDGAAAQALQDAHENEELEIGRDAGKERAGREGDRADEIEAAPAEDRGQPPAGRDHHRVGGQIGR